MAYVVRLRQSQAKAEAQILLGRLRAGTDVEVDNWEVLAWLNEMLQYVDEPLRDKVTYLREGPGRKPEATYTVDQIRTAIEQDIECRPQPPMELVLPRVQTSV